MAGAAPGVSLHVLLPSVEPRENWPASVGQGLDVQVFGLGGIAREQAVSWSRTLERSLCYSYGCWEVLEKKRPRAIDLVVGRSMGLGSSLFAPVYAPAAPVVSFLDYFYHAHQHDLAGEAGPETAPAYFHWRRSMAAIDLLDLEQAALALDAHSLAARALSRRIPRLRSSFCTTASTPAASPLLRGRPAVPSRVRSPAARFPARRVSSASSPARSTASAGSTDSSSWPTACCGLRPDVICVVVGDRIVRRGT